MTNMTWKHAIFLGGAVLILAACADVTAPSPNLQPTTGRASVKTSGTSAKEPTTTTATPTGIDCRTGYSVQVGYIDVRGVCDF